MQELTGFQVDLLTVIVQIDDEELSGSDIKQHLEDKDPFPYGTGELNHGRLYPNLDTLVAKGLVDKGEIDRRTNSYEPTDAGRVEIEERRDTLDDAVDESGGDGTRGVVA